MNRQMKLVYGQNFLLEKLNEGKILKGLDKAIRRNPHLIPELLTRLSSTSHLKAFEKIVKIDCDRQYPNFYKMMEVFGIMHKCIVKGKIAFVYVILDNYSALFPFYFYPEFVKWCYVNKHSKCLAILSLGVKGGRYGKIDEKAQEKLYQHKED